MQLYLDCILSNIRLATILFKWRRYHYWWKDAKLGPFLSVHSLSHREGSWSCHTYGETWPPFSPSHPEDRPILSPCTKKKQGVPSTYSKPGPLISEGMPWYQQQKRVAPGKTMSIQTRKKSPKCIRFTPFRYSIFL